MNLIAVKIIFSAELGSSRIRNQTVSLGGIYPDIEIENCNSTEGIHRFKILKNLPDLGQKMLSSAEAEASQQIEIFWNILAYLYQANIRPLPNIEYEVNNVESPLQLKITGHAPNAITIAEPNWFIANAPDFHRKYDYDLLKRYNFARGLADPISRFISLYALLASISDDLQANTDALIAQEDPTVSKSYSPKNGKPETIFTRLRNELAHDREGVSVFNTHDEIRLHVARFEWIVGRILHSKIQST